MKREKECRVFEISANSDAEGKVWNIVTAGKYLL
jgi:hypothetical protein